MSVWPDRMKYGPIREWPGAMTPAEHRRASPFASTLTATLKTLEREIWHLSTTATQQESAELLLAIPAGAFTKDGRPYANARAEHPGVIFSMDSKHGRVSYPCDAFTEWQENLRAIALALEALRKVDRYGVTRHGEQYRGFMALEAGSTITSVDDAFATISKIARVSGGYAWDQPAHALRMAQRNAHPDTGGSAQLWHDVAAAERALRDAGLLG